MSEDIRNNLKTGMIVKVHQIIREKNAKGEEKERIQIFEGIILATKHGNEPGATITVRKDSKGFAVEKIFPIHSPVVAKIELVRRMRVRRAKGFFLRDYKKRLVEVKKPKKSSSVKAKSDKQEEKKAKKPEIKKEEKPAKDVKAPKDEEKKEKAAKA